jgi:hypothetical protein
LRTNFFRPAIRLLCYYGTDFLALTDLISNQRNVYAS